jgi:hypothetical protein
MSCFKIICYLFICVCLLLNIASCQRNSIDITEVLTTLEQTVEKSPDSVLLILDSIIDPYNLGKEDYNKFLLLQIQAKDKAYKDIAKDTVIFQVRDYYVKIDDMQNLALAQFYCGRVRQYQQEDTLAISEYLQAGKYAEHTENNILKGLIEGSMGSIFFKELVETKAIEHFVKAAQYFHRAKHTRNEVITYSQIGNTYLMMSRSDSAFYYYNRGLGLAKANDDSLQIAILTHSLGVAYRETGKYDLAEKYIRDAAKYATDDKNKIKQYLNLSKVYYKRELSDSAKTYINKSLSLLSGNKDVFVAANIYKTLSLISEEEFDFKQSLDYCREYARNLEEIAKGNKSKEILELQEKYNNERLQNENNRLKVRSQQRFLFSIITLSALCFITLFFYIRNVQKKRAMLEKDNELLEKNNELIEAKAKIYQLLEMAESYNNKADSGRNLLLHHFDILKKVSLLRQYLRDDDEQSQRLVKKFNKIVYGQESMNWDIFYRDMNNIHNGLFNRLKEQFPTLDETEFRICCLAYAGFSCSESGIIMECSHHTIEKKRLSVRKKLGIPSKGSIPEFLDQLLNS